jgi:hypothetical protein
MRYAQVNTTIQGRLQVTEVYDTTVISHISAHCKNNLLQLSVVQIFVYLLISIQGTIIY